MKGIKALAISVVLFAIVIAIQLTTYKYTGLTLLLLIAGLVIGMYADDQLDQDYMDYRKEHGYEE